MSYGPEVRRGGNLPFGMFCAQWMCDPRYSANARALYGILITYADTQARHTALGKPYRRELARQLGVSLSTLDRTLLELEVGGLIRVEERKNPENPLDNDANIYHLLDAPLMWQGNGTWTDPLGPGVLAADVAKEVTESRRAEKRAAGLVRKGGVAKGISTKAVKAAREAAQEEEGGSSMGAATPGSTHAARVAAPVLPNIQSPVQTPSPDPDALSARSAGDARRASDGSSAREDECGFAASGKTKPSPTTSKTSAAGRKKRHTKAELDVVRQVLVFFPPELDRDKLRLPAVSEAILSAMATDGRTPEQIGERILYRWLHHGYADKYADGALKSPVGAAIGMVRPLRRGDRYACPDARCENGRDINTGEDCRLCAVRIADWKAAQVRKRERKQGQPKRSSGPVMPTQRSAQPRRGPLLKDCAEPACPRSIPATGGPLCGDCQADVLAAEEAARETLAAWEAETATAQAPVVEQPDEEAEKTARLRAQIAAQIGTPEQVAAYCSPPPF